MKKTSNPFFIYPSYFIIIVFSFAISYVFLLHQQNAMPLFGSNKGDAGWYILIAHDITAGLRSGFRTYGYPLFLKLIQYPYTANVESLQIFSFYILTIQYFLYVSSVFLFSFAVTNNQNARLIITAGLLLNIHILSFLSVTLTETVSISTLLICCAIFYGMKKNSLRAFCIGLFAAFSIEVRPANLWVYCFMFTLLLLEFIDNKYTKKEIINTLLLFMIGSFISFAPQMYFNYVNFHSINPLLRGRLAQSQYEWGKEFAFYSCTLVPPLSLFKVQNPFMLTSPHPFTWLSINGLSYGLFKVMIMFHHSSLFPYQFMKIAYQQIAIFFSSFNTYFGMLGLIVQNKKIPIEKIRAILIGLCFCILLHLCTALEDRFTFAICLLLMPFAIYQSWQCFKEKKYIYLVLFIPFFLFSNLFNNILESLSPSYVSLVQNKAIQ